MEYLHFGSSNEKKVIIFGMSSPTNKLELHSKYVRTWIWMVIKLGENVKFPVSGNLGKCAALAQCYLIIF